jgi:hypothetical protein
MTASWAIVKAMPKRVLSRAASTGSAVGRAGAGSVTGWSMADIGVLSVFVGPAGCGVGRT